MIDKRLVTATIITLGVGLYLWRPWHVPSDREKDYPRYCLEVGQSRYKALELEPLRSHTLESLKQSFKPDSSEVSYTSRVDADVAGLMHDVAEFVYFRFVQPSPAEYRAWRDRCGYVPRAMAELTRNPHGMPAAFLAAVGRPLGDAPAFAASFDAMFAPALDYGGGLNRPAKVATRGPGLCVLLMPPPTTSPTTSATTSDTLRPRVHGTIEADFWRGMSATNATSWWTLPPSVLASTVEPGAAGPGPDAVAPDAVAEVGIVIEYADGSRYPVQTRWLHSATARKWYIDKWTLNNFPDGLALSTEDF